MEGQGVFRRALRGSPIALMALVLFAVVLSLIDTQSPVVARCAYTAQSLSELALAAYVAYWVDRYLFPYARPHLLEGSAGIAAQLRRALIVSAGVIALAIAQ